MGFGCISRRRTFTVLVDKSQGRFLADPSVVYQALCAGLADAQLTMSELSKAAGPQDLDRELAQSGNSLDAYPNNILSNFELKNQQKYEELAKDLPEDSVVNTAYCLNQNPDHRRKLASDGVLPALTKTDKLIWLRGQGRHMLASEKFAAHSWAVKEDLATLLGIPVFDPYTLSNPHPVIGNGQHVAVAAVVVAAALLSIEFFQPIVPEMPLTAPADDGTADAMESDSMEQACFVLINMS